MIDNSDSITHSFAMFSSSSKPGSNSQDEAQNHGSSRGRGRNSSNRGKGGRYNHDSGQHFSPQHFSPQASQSFSLQPFQHQNVSQNLQHQNSSQNFKVDRPSCQICGESRHQALDFYLRMDFAYHDKNPLAKLVAMASASNAAITNNQDPWLVDSGTSDHLTTNLNNLTILS